MNKDIKILYKVVEDITYDLENDLDKVIDYLKSKQDNKPPNTISSYIDFYYVHDYDGGYKRVINLVHKRYETDEEYNSRLAKEDELNKKIKEDKEKLFEQLKKELGK